MTIGGYNSARGAFPPPISRDTIEVVRADGHGTADPIINFTSNDFSYYDYFDWPSEIDWYRPR